MTSDLPVASDDSFEPTISIYQNADHVAGIVQQAFQRPLVTEEDREYTGERGDSSSSETGAEGSVEGGVTVPFAAKGAATIGGHLKEHATREMVTSTRSVQRFVYSQAYYLDLVKHTLRARNSLKTVASLSDANDLVTGDFVEYTATFRANEMNSLLDILTPDLVAAITHFHSRNDGIQRFEGFDDFEAMRAFSFKNNEEATAKADLARSITEAVQVDFRSQHTREFNGLIGEGDSFVTAVTVCDNAHFVVDDEDRILDGNFTVLGKVATPVNQDVPVFARNKLLERLKPEAVDGAFAEIRKSVAAPARRFEERARGDVVGDNSAVEDVLDVAFSSRVAGASFKVIPIAIYI